MDYLTSGQRPIKVLADRGGASGGVDCFVDSVSDVLRREGLMNQLAGVAEQSAGYARLERA